MIIKRFSETGKDIPEFIRDTTCDRLDEVDNILETVDQSVVGKPVRKKLRLFKNALSGIKGLIIKDNPKHKNKSKNN